jgi:hypothetical protein
MVMVPTTLPVRESDLRLDRIASPSPLRAGAGDACEVQQHLK